MYNTGVFYVDKNVENELKLVLFLTLASVRAGGSTLSLFGAKIDITCLISTKYMYEASFLPTLHETVDMITPTLHHHQCPQLALQAAHQVD